MTPEEIRHRLDRGALTRFRRGGYGAVLEESPEERHLRLMLATVPLVDGESVFSHTSAAVLHGLPVRLVSLQQATMIRRTSGHGNGTRNLRVRNTRLAANQVMDVEGLRVTTLARTVCDQARLEPFEWGVASADAALRMGLSIEELRFELFRFPRLFGIRRAQQVLRFADGAAESPGESLSRVQMARLGIPEPILQFEIFDENGELVARTDFGWPEHGLVGEMDGETKYGELLKPNEKPSHVIMREKQREQRLRRLGWWPVRWGWAEANARDLLAPILLDGFENALPRAS